MLMLLHHQLLPTIEADAASGCRFKIGRPTKKTPIFNNTSVHEVTKNYRNGAEFNDA